MLASLMLKLISIALLILTAAACGKNKSNSNSSKPQVEPIHERQLELTQRESVSFVRREQMVNRYDCKGVLTSRKLETSNSLSSKITINYENRKKAWSYTVYNRRTKSSNMGAFVTDGKFVVDYAPTVFNMRVKAGINDIEYVFNRCTKTQKNPDGETVCIGKVEVEKEGLIQLDVTYSSTVIPGEQTIKPSCKE